MPAGLAAAAPKRRAERRSLSTAVLATLICGLLAGGAEAQPRGATTVTIGDGGESKTVTVGRVGDALEPPVLDGRLDDPAWASAGVIDDFHQVTPVEYSAPSQPTRVYLLHDSEMLYVGVRLDDSEATRINALVLRQGEGLGTDDRFFLMIDSFANRRSGYLFGMNPNGVRFDGLFQNVTERQFDWDSIWYGASSIDESGWSIEYAIPFSTLAFDPTNGSWRMNFQRTIARNNEVSAWASRNHRTDVSIMGNVEGLSGLEQGIGLDVVPSVSVTDIKAWAPSGSDGDTKPSLDAFYKITPSLNGALTINTDFSATEIDSRQVNLTRFSLFFPEKRDFFLQDLDIFQFGRIGGSDSGQTELTNTATTRASRESGRPFFSRRLGLSADGAPVDLDYGGKLSGRIGQRWDIGALAIRQAEFAGVDATDALVARVAANVLEESSVGFIATSGDPRSNLDNELLGIDFRYLMSRLPGGRSLEAEGWYQQTETEGLEGNDGAAGVGVRLPNRTGLRGGLAVKRLEENFRPALGFINTAGIREYTAELGYTHRPGGGPVRTVFSGLDASRASFIDGDLQSEVLSYRLLELDSHERDQLNLRAFSTTEGLPEPFEISEGVVIPAGEYRFDEHYLELVTGVQRRWSGSFVYRGGEFYDGERLGLTTRLRWRPSRHLRANVEYEFNDVELPYGDFITRLVRLQLDLVFSNKLSWVNLIQYDNISEVAGINSRLHWIPEAGREAYLVLNHNLQDLDRDNSFSSMSADLTLKLTYTFRF